MHVYLAADCPQCRSTTLVLTHREDAWGKDHAVNCGVWGRWVIAAGLSGKGLMFFGSQDPDEWGNKLWDMDREGVEPFTERELDRRVEEQKVNGCLLHGVKHCEECLLGGPGNYVQL